MVEAQHQNRKIQKTLTSPFFFFFFGPVADSRISLNPTHTQATRSSRNDIAGMMRRRSYSATMTCMSERGECTFVVCIEGSGKTLEQEGVLSDIRLTQRVDCSLAQLHPLRPHNHALLCGGWWLGKKRDVPRGCVTCKLTFFWWWGWRMCAPLIRKTIAALIAMLAGYRSARS